jgi:hypothetical protein
MSCTLTGTVMPVHHDEAVAVAARVADVRSLVARWRAGRKTSPGEGDLPALLRLTG